MTVHARADHVRSFNRRKRIADLVLIFLASPILVMAGLLAGMVTRVGLGRPVLFRQPRVGLGEKPFELLKFRTMTEEKADDGQPLPDAERLTGVGRFLRRTSLDELPQIINVLRGDMSLIGPRPLPLSYLPFYFADERVRHSVRPGITGLAQVSGRNGLLWDERLHVDAEYARRARLAGDAVILVRTVRQVLFGKNVSVLAGDSGEPLNVARSYPRRDGLALRRFEFVDVPTRVRWFGDPAIRRHMTLPDNVTVDGTIEWLRSARRDPARRDLVVYEESTGAVVALLGIRHRDNAKLPELYILVDPSRHGAGIGTTSLGLLVDWMRQNDMGAGCYLTVSKQNVAAIAVYARHGFEVVKELENGERLEMELKWGPCLDSLV